MHFTYLDGVYGLEFTLKTQDAAEDKTTNRSKDPQINCFSII